MLDNSSQNWEGTEAFYCCVRLSRRTDLRVPLLTRTHGAIPITTSHSLWDIFAMLSSRLVLPLQNLYQNRLLGLAAMASPTRGSRTRQRCKDAARHSYGPDSYAVNGLTQEGFMLGLPRSTSDTDLVSPDARSTLAISSSHYTIGQSEDMVVTWDIKEEVDAGDWIGMYLVGKSAGTLGH